MSDIDIEKARAAQRAYAKAWRAKNPDKVREKNLRYWARRAEREAQEANISATADQKVSGDNDG